MRSSVKDKLSELMRELTQTTRRTSTKRPTSLHSRVPAKASTSRAYKAISISSARSTCCFRDRAFRISTRNELISGKIVLKVVT